MKHNKSSTKPSLKKNSRMRMDEREKERGRDRKNEMLFLVIFIFNFFFLFRICNDQMYCIVQTIFLKHCLNRNMNVRFTKNVNVVLLPLLMSYGFLFNSFANFFQFSCDVVLFKKLTAICLANWFKLGEAAREIEK